MFGKPIKYFVSNWLWSVAMNLILLAVVVKLCYATKYFGAHCLSDILFQPNIFFQTSKVISSSFLSITRTFFSLAWQMVYCRFMRVYLKNLILKKWEIFNSIVRQFCRAWSWILRAEYRCDRTTVTNMEKIFFIQRKSMNLWTIPKRMRLLDPSTVGWVDFRFASPISFIS